MTAKEKAIELHDKYYRIFERLGLDELPNKYAKEHAFICIKEVVTELNKLPSKDMSDLQFWGEVDYELSLL